MRGNWPRIWLTVVMALLGLSVALRLPTEVAERLEPITGSRPDYGPQAVVVAPDQRIFTLFAALNAAGYDDEAAGLALHPIRQRVRAALAERDLPSLARLRPIFDHVADYHLVAWVLQRGDPPDFKRAEVGWWVSTRASDFDGLDEALGDFYREAGIATLWRDVEPAYRIDIDRWQPSAEAVLEDIRAYLRIDAVPFRQAVVLPNLLDAHYRGTGPQIGAIAYVVAGPTETELSLQGLIGHELLHSIVDPMLDQRMSQIPVQTSRRLYAVLVETMPPGYGSWESALEETLNRAINTRMLEDEGLRVRQLDQLEEEGFLLIRPLDQALAAYERSGQSFEEYLSALLTVLDAVEPVSE